MFIFRIFGFEKLIAKIYAEWQNNAKLNKVPSKNSPSLGENDGKFISTWNFGFTIYYSSSWKNGEYRESACFITGLNNANGRSRDQETFTHINCGHAKRELC